MAAFEGHFEVQGIQWSSGNNNASRQEYQFSK
jgi:hypothetical protein